MYKWTTVSAEVQYHPHGNIEKSFQIEMVNHGQSPKTHIVRTTMQIISNFDSNAI